MLLLKFHRYVLCVFFCFLTSYLFQGPKVLHNFSLNAGDLQSSRYGSYVQSKMYFWSAHFRQDILHIFGVIRKVITSC